MPLTPVMFGIVCPLLFLAGLVNLTLAVPSVAAAVPGSSLALSRGVKIVRPVILLVLLLLLAKILIGF